MSEFAGEHGESQDVKLSESEIKLVAKLFSDPTYFPVEFRTWLKNYIEGSGIQINASQIRGGAGRSVGLPPGIVLPYAGGQIGPDVIPCDGQAVSRITYDGLWDAIGSTWGAGDGSTTFNVPDLRDRSLFGAGAVVGLGGHDGRNLGSRGGPSHHHYFIDSSDISAGGQTDWEGDHAHGITVVQASGYNMLEGQQSLRTIATPLVSNLGTGGAGGHDHGVSVWGSVSIDGNTTGGYDQNKVSYAGIKYVITSGKAA